MMTKRVTIDPQTNLVLNVEVVDEATPIGVRVPDDTVVGRGMVWNESREAPEFMLVEDAPADAGGEPDAP